MRGYQTNLPGWPPRAAPNGSIKPLLEAQESSTKVQSKLISLYVDDEDGRQVLDCV